MALIAGLPAAAAALPDSLGVHPGMAPREAYEILQGVAPARSVDLDPMSTPEL